MPRLEEDEAGAGEDTELLSLGVVGAEGVPESELKVNIALGGLGRGNVSFGGAETGVVGDTGDRGSRSGNIFDPFSLGDSGTGSRAFGVGVEDVLCDLIFPLGASSKSGVVVGPSVTLVERTERVGLAGASVSAITGVVLAWGAFVGDDLLRETLEVCVGVSGSPLGLGDSAGTLLGAGTGSGDDSWLGSESLTELRELGSAESGEEPLGVALGPGSVIGVRLGKVSADGDWGCALGISGRRRGCGEGRGEGRGEGCGEGEGDGDSRAMVGSSLCPESQ